MGYVSKEIEEIELLKKKILEDLNAENYKKTMEEVDKKLKEMFPDPPPIDD